MLFFQPDTANGDTYLTPEESKHCVRVLRRKAGDAIRVADGKGTFYDVRITDAHSGKCRFEVVDKTFHPRPQAVRHVALSPTKNADRTEWFAEKAVEIGIDRISFILCEHSERKKVNLDRIKKVIISALKQSAQPWLPELGDLLSLDAFLPASSDQLLVAERTPGARPLLAAAAPGRSTTVMIGPEGGFTPAELERVAAHHGIPVTLGASRLRTETAGLVACHLLNLLNP